MRVVIPENFVVGAMFLISLFVCLFVHRITQQTADEFQISR